MARGIRAAVVHRLLRWELRLRHLRARRRADPWNFEADDEQFRFRETNRIIGEQFGRVGTLLELGCGEGHQSEHLARTCESLTGLEFSPLSVRRAADRLPLARFEVADLESLNVADWPDRFDLVAACECLYYLRDVEGALRTIDALGKTCLVSSVQLKFVSLDSYLEGRPGVESETIRSGGWTWKLHWWQGGRLERSRNPSSSAEGVAGAEALGSPRSSAQQTDNLA